MSECVGPGCDHPDCTNHNKPGLVDRMEMARRLCNISVEKWSVMNRKARRAAFQSVRKYLE